MRGFFSLQQYQAKKTAPVWRSQESEDWNFCIKILSHTISNQDIHSGLKNSLHAKFPYNLRALCNSLRLSNVPIYTSTNSFLQLTVAWTTPFPLGCDAQVDNAFPCYAADKAIIQLLLLVMPKLCTANTCGTGKCVSQLSVQQTEDSRAYEEKQTNKTHLKVRGRSLNTILLP